MKELSGEELSFLGSDRSIGRCRQRLCHRIRGDSVVLCVLNWLPLVLIQVEATAEDASPQAPRYENHVHVFVAITGGVSGRSCSGGDDGPRRRISFAVRNNDPDMSVELVTPTKVQNLLLNEFKVSESH